MSGLERLFRKQIVYHNRLTNKTDDRIETIRVFYFNKNILLIHHTTNLKALRKSEGGGGDEIVQEYWMRTTQNSGERDQWETK